MFDRDIDRLQLARIPWVPVVPDAGKIALQLPGRGLRLAFANCIQRNRDLGAQREKFKRMVARAAARR